MYKFLSTLVALMTTIGLYGAAPEEPDSYKVGDFYEKKGKRSIVLEVDKSGKHGKIISVDKTILPWADRSVPEDMAGVTCEDDGEVNFIKIMHRSDAYQFYAVQWCLNMVMSGICLLCMS